MNCVRAGTSAARCETKNSSVLCGACSRWIKNKEFPLPNFPPWNFFFFPQTEVACLSLCSWPNTTEKRGGVELNQITSSLMLRLSCVSHFLINPRLRCKAAPHPMKLQSISSCVMNARQPSAKWARHSGHFHNNVKRWWKEIGEEQHLGPLWSLMTLRGRGKEGGEKDEASLNIFLSLCLVIKDTNESEWRVHPLLKIRHRQKLISYFKSSDRKSSTRGYRGLKLFTHHLQPTHPLKTAAMRPFLHIWIQDVFTKKSLPLWALNKALLLRPGPSMTMTWFPWDFYGNWLNLCNLIKVLGSKQEEENENRGWSCGWDGRKWRTLTDMLLQ